MIKTESIKKFMFVAFSEIIRLVSNRRNGEFKMFRMPADKVIKHNPDVKKEFYSILQRNIEKMNSYYDIVSNKNSTINIFSENSKVLESIPDGSVDLVITSPPYGDSKTTVAYGEFSRLSLQWIDLEELSEKDIMGIDKSLMGGKKYRNGFECKIQSQTLRTALEKIIELDVERAGDVYSFYEDLAESLSSIAKKTKKDGYHFWVVGNRTVKGIYLETDKIIAEMCSQYGLKHLHTATRNIVNKVMPNRNSPTNIEGKTSKTMTKEFIVIMKKQ